VSDNLKTQEDTTELNLELEALRHREKLLDVAEQLANIGHCEWDYDNDCIKSCSEGYARLFNQSVAEVIEAHSSWIKYCNRSILTTANVTPDPMSRNAKLVHMK
jgi:hypothetical protein